MIGQSDNIGRTHDHTITNCIHNTQATPKEKGGSSGGGNVQDTEWQPEIQKHNTIPHNVFSIPMVLTNSLKNIRTKLINFWNSSPDSVNSVDSGKAPSDTLATLMIKDESKKIDGFEEDEIERKVANVEGAVSGGLRKEQGNIKKFLHNVAETMSKAKKPWKKSMGKENQDLPPIHVNEDNDTSYLLDSYSKRGEYSTLAKDRSLDSNFKTRG